MIKNYKIKISKNLFKMKGVYSMIITSISLGTIGLFIKLINSGISFFTVNFLRIFIGFLFLLLFVPIIDKSFLKVNKKDIKNYVFIGFLFAISISLYTTSIFFTTIQSAVLINYSYPLFLLIFAYFILNEKLSSIKLFSMGLAFIGLIIINPISNLDNLFGNFLALIATIFYSLLIVMMKKEDNNYNIGKILWYLFFASLFTLPLAIYGGFNNIRNSLFYIIGLGVISTGIAYFFYNLALLNLEAEIASVIAMILTPLVSILFAILVIGENFNSRYLIGGLFLILAGIYLNLGYKINFYFINYFYLLRDKISFFKSKED